MSSNLTLTTTEDEPERPEKSRPAFVAERGQILVRRSKSVGRLKCDYSRIIKAESVVVMLAKNSQRLEDAAFKVRLEASGGEDEPTYSSSIQFGEIAELISAVTYISNMAKKMASATPTGEYTEATYSTSDEVEGVQVGFYADVRGEIRTFIQLGSNESVFGNLNTLAGFKQLLDVCRDDLIKKGAKDVEAVDTPEYG